MPIPTAFISSPLGRPRDAQYCYRYAFADGCAPAPAPALNQHFACIPVALESAVGMWSPAARCPLLLSSTEKQVQAAYSLDALYSIPTSHRLPDNPQHLHTTRLSSGCAHRSASHPCNTFFRWHSAHGFLGLRCAIILHVLHLSPASTDRLSCARRRSGRQRPMVSITLRVLINRYVELRPLRTCTVDS